LPDELTDDWRIDDLAQRAGITVDTIRYYQREGLLPSGERAGRTRRYGPEHLERLERIRALQSRRFSLAAIRALLDRQTPGALEGLLAGPDDVTYDFAELVAAAGIPEQFAGALVEVGLLREPADHGRAAYDADDLTVLRSFADLRRLSVSDAVLLETARLYTSAFDELQRRLVALYSDPSSAHWAAGDHTQFVDLAPESTTRMARDLRMISDYTLQRNLQRQVLLAIERQTLAGTGASDASDAAPGLASDAG
jgi:DNA-binding transcriptional MerR regulator